MNKIIKYVIVDITRNKIVLFYTVFLLLISLSIFSFDDNTSKGLISLMNVILLIVPLVSIIFSSIYIYNSSEFIDLLVCQPIRRRFIWLSVFSGLSSSLCIAFLLGSGIVILLNEPSITGLVMVVCGCLLTIVFTAISMLATVTTRDKARGIGKAILLWLYFAVIYDAIVLFLLFQFSDYPLEKPMMVMSALNPIDLTRINILLRLDISALMGYTGAVFKDFFGTHKGILISLGLLVLWAALPMWRSTVKFQKKDL